MRRLQDEGGQTVLEYALVAAFVGLGLALLLLQIGEGVVDRANDGWMAILELTGG
ncbi:MAG: hypothetical protein IH609_21435 [Dehalococcoidia bacterium]|nr:hypothetical protein [Dehalococcoidia bacterium]